MMNEYKYWFIYLDEGFALEYGYNELLYAYTDDKALLKSFKQTRNMKLFHIKKNYLSKEQVSELTRVKKNNILVKYQFDINSSYIIPLTLEEKIDINGIANSIAYKEIYLSAIQIPPSIFVKKYSKTLNHIGYNTFHNIYSHGAGDCAFCMNGIVPDIPKILIKQYGLLLDFKE